MPLLNVNGLVALENGEQPGPFADRPLEGPSPKPREFTMMVATCSLCRAWYSMDFEEGLPDDHFDMRTGEPCHNEFDWHIDEVPYREDWRDAK